LDFFKLWRVLINGSKQQVKRQLSDGWKLDDIKVAIVDHRVINRLEVYIPLYIGNVRAPNEKEYWIIVNGQNGYIIGSYPLSIAKVFTISTLSIATLAGLWFLMMTYLDEKSRTPVIVILIIFAIVIVVSLIKALWPKDFD
jgi:hypothetical protein